MNIKLHLRQPEVTTSPARSCMHKELDRFMEATKSQPLNPTETTFDQAAYQAWPTFTPITLLFPPAHLFQLTFQHNSPSYLGQPRRPAGRQQRQGRGTSCLVLSEDLSEAGEMRVVEILSWTLLSGKAGDPCIYSAFLSREEGSREGLAAHGTSHGSLHRTTTGPSTLHLGMLAKFCSPQMWYRNPIQMKTIECDRSEW